MLRDTTTGTEGAKLQFLYNVFYLFVCLFVYLNSNLQTTVLPVIPLSPSTGFGSREASVQVLPLPLSSPHGFGKLFHPSEPQFAYLQHARNNSTPIGFLGRLNEFTDAVYFALCVVYSKHPITAITLSNHATKTPDGA